MKAKTLFIMAAAALLAGLNPFPLKAAHLVERIAARVNNEIVTQRQFDQERQKLHAQLAQQYSGVELEQKVREGSKNLLRDLIDQDLLVEKAKDDDISVETDVVKRLDEIRQQYGLRSLEDLQKEVEKQGIIWEDFKDQIRRNLLMRQVIEREVGSRIVVSRGDARKFFEGHKNLFESPPGVRLAEILVSSDKHKSGEAEKLAQQAYKELKSGARWSDVVTKYSDGPTASEGGDIGFFKQGTVAGSIQEAISKLDVNEYTAPIQSKYGYIIIRVLQRRTGSTPTFEQVDQQVMNYLYNEQMQKQLRAYLVQLRKESFIRLAPGFVDTGAPHPSEEGSLDLPEGQ